MYIDNVSVKEVTSFSGGGLETEAYKLVEDTSNGGHSISVQVGTADGNSNTASVYVKYANETKVIELSNGTLSDELIKVDISNGTLFSQGSSVDNYAITPMANGWYRLSVTTTNAIRKIIVSQLTDGGLTNYQGDGTSGIYLAYAQLEEQASATSLMLPAVEGSTSSRVADVVDNGGSQSLFGGVNSSGVLYAEIAALSDDGTNKYISLSGSGSSNSIALRYISSNRVLGSIIKGGVGQAEIIHTLTDMTDVHKVAFRWYGDTTSASNGRFSLWVDGVMVESEDVSGLTLPSLTLMELNFDRGDGVNKFYGKTKGVAVLNYLSDTEMIKLTTV
jgi:hypothetical protein